MANGKDSRGRFAPGNNYGSKSNGGGRPKDAERAKIIEIIDANVPSEAVDAAWKRIAVILKTGGPGWLQFFEMYLDRRYGRPAQSIKADVDMSAFVVKVEWDEDNTDSGEAA